MRAFHKSFVICLRGMVTTGIVAVPFLLFFGVSEGVSAIVQGLIYLGYAFFILFGFLALITVLRFQKLRMLFGALIASFTISWQYFTYVLSVALIIALISGSKIQLPSPNSFAANGSAGLAAGAFVLFLKDFLQALGFPPNAGLSEKPAFRVKINWVFIAMALWASFMAGFKPSFFALPIVISTICLMAFSAIFTHKMAISAFESASVARSKAVRKRTGAAWSVHLTDAHITRKGRQCIEGGKGGNERLQDCTTIFLEEPPKFVFITGDLTDHGDEEEWEEVHSILAPLKEKGTRIVIVPGNHDLATAYNSTDAFISTRLTHFRGGMIRGMNGLRLRAFLHSMAALEPGLKNAKGETIEAILKQEDKNLNRLWSLIEETRMLVSTNPLAKLYEKERFCKTASSLFPQYPPSMGWEALLWTSNESFNDFYVSSLYAERWQDYFPLYLVDEAIGAKIIVLNSIARDPTLMGSAWGDLGQDQISRLEEIIRNSTSRQFVVLAHHAPFRWYDERPPGFTLEEIQRWACLAVSISSVNRFSTILSRIQRDKKKLFFFCGHRHGGKLHEARIGDWHGGQVAEGASLADEDARIIAAWQESTGKLRLGMI